MTGQVYIYLFDAVGLPLGSHHFLSHFYRFFSLPALHSALSSDNSWEEMYTTYHHLFCSWIQLYF